MVQAEFTGLREQWPSGVEGRWRGEGEEAREAVRECEEEQGGWGRE